MFTRTDQVTPAVLVIDSDPLMLTAMGSVLDMQGYRAVLARDEALAMQSISCGTFDSIVLSIEDLQSGCDFAAKLRSLETTREVPVIFLVPELSSSWMPKLASGGGVYCLLKPIDPYALIDLVEKTLWLPHIAKGRGSLSSGMHLSPSNETNTKQPDWVTLN